jgi:hypothetical protein
VRKTLIAAAAAGALFAVPMLAQAGAPECEITGDAEDGYWECRLTEGYSNIPAWPEDLDLFYDATDPGVGDEIEDYLDGAVAPYDAWQAVVYYNGTAWVQHFNNPPLQSFQTLTELESGTSYWLFVTEESTLSLPEMSGE